MQLLEIIAALRGIRDTVDRVEAAVEANGYADVGARGELVAHLATARDSISAAISSALDLRLQLIGEDQRS